MTDQFRTVIIPLTGIPLGRNVAKAFQNVGPDMFTVRLSASGSEPATHVISSGMIPVVFTEVIPLKSWVKESASWKSEDLSPGDATKLRERALEGGMSVTAQQAANIIAAMDVSEQPPFEAMARMGLKIIHPTDV